MVVGSIPTRVTMEAPMVMKATDNYVMISTFLEKTGSTVSGF